MKKIFGFALIVIATSTSLMAFDAGVPEIDAATGSSALALVAGALLVMRARSK